MDELQLLRDYVATMQRQLQSKNRQLKTLRQHNQKLIRQNQKLSMSRSYVLNTTVCGQCTKNQRQLNQLQVICSNLQTKYDNLQKQKSTSSLSSSVRVMSTTCYQCAKLKRQLQDMYFKYNNLQKSHSTYVTSSKIYTPCTECSKYKGQILNKQGTISRLNSQISLKNTCISSLQSEIQNINKMKTVTYTQNISRSTDLQRITYLNGQVQQYIALVNSLRSQIKALNDQNQRYLFRIRQIQSKPRQIQYIQKGLSPQIKQQIRSLKVQIGELSNDNILLRRQNSSLKRQVLSIPKNSQIIIETQPYEQPVRYNQIIYQEDRSARHYRKSPISKNKYILSQSMSRLPHNQQIKYDDLQRKIQLLQMQNEHLRGTIYSDI